VARPDHYAVLGVPRTATDAEIKAAFRKLARQLHPDTQHGSPEPADERRFKRVARAYETLSRPARRRAYDERHARGRFAAPGGAGPSSYVVEGAGPVYHSDLGHHSDFYQAGDPLSVSEASGIVRRHPSWLRRAIRTGRLAATRDPDGRYLLRRRDVERLDRTARRRPRPSTAGEGATDAAEARSPDEAEA
jgi:curved DNA-binding protein CbpA